MIGLRSYQDIPERDCLPRLEPEEPQPSYPVHEFGECHWGERCRLMDAEIARLRADLARLRALCEAQEKYIALLEAEESDLVGIAVAHGWNGSTERHAEGIRLRALIAAAREEGKP